MDFLSVAGVPIITAIVTAAIQGYKYIINGSEKLTRIIPIIGASLGVILGIVAFYAVESLIPADNIFTAMIIGGVSGLASTGGHQIFKQLSNNDSDKTEDKNE